MGIFFSKSYYKRKFNNKIISVIFIISIFIISISVNSNYISNSERNKTFIDNKYDLKSSTPYLFQGSEPALNITDNGKLIKINQEVSLTNHEELNLSYYLDDVHNWKVNKIETNIKDLQDTRNWVNNSDFKSVNVYREYLIPAVTTAPEYSSNLDYYITEDLIFKNGATAIRAHFVNISFQDHKDFVVIWSNEPDIYYWDTGVKEDFFSPWIPGDTIDLCIESDNNIKDYGYYIDYIEFVNDSSNLDDNLYSWGFNQDNSWSTNYGSAKLENDTAMYVHITSTVSGVKGDFSAQYPKDNFTELYQNITIPRGSVVDAYISFDYYPEFCIDDNNIFIYLEINKKKIYSKGLGDIAIQGRREWHSTGKIYMPLWVNSSPIFENKLYNQELNISIGIKSSSSVWYSGFDDMFQQMFWFDNITFGITTIANSTQNGIDLTVDGKNLNDLSKWGYSRYNLTGNWDTNPVKLMFNTSSPSLFFLLNTTLYGVHNSTSKINQQNDEGLHYSILRNGTIIWEFYHNFYMPSQYSDFEFKIYKPLNWKFISALDPTLQARSFEGGNIGDNYLKINSTNAIFPGWWSFKAISPNYLNINNTMISKNGQWGFNEFYSGDSIRVKTQVNSTNEILLNLDTTVVNLTIYYPNSSIWYQESKIPLSNGTVIFSDILLTSLNSVGGVYNYTLFWSNGTAIGGLLSNFIVIHNSYLTILKPDDAKLDNQTGGTVGDIIPLRIYLRDAENNIYISDALISYNWTTGTVFLVEASLGIYEAVLDTADLGGFGLYNIIISTSKVGFINSNLTLRINLGEDTNLQRLESDSKIVIHTNSTIRFFYYSEFDEEGILGAQVLVNISNPAYYTVQDESDGYYSIEFSTEFIDSLGVYRLVFEFSAIGYEPQTHIFQFEIINPTVTREKPNYML